MYNAIDITKELISIDSTNPGKYEYAVFLYLREKLLNLKNVAIYESEVIDGRKNLMGVIKSNNATQNDFVMICHMDTVVVGDGWTKEPFNPVEINEKIYGRGSTDMKSGLAVAISAFSYASETVNDSLDRNIKIIFTCDEEADMKGVDKVIEDGWVTKDDIVCDLEPTDNNICIAHKGRLWIKLIVRGKTAHASMPENGIDANIVISKIINYFSDIVNKLSVDDVLGKTTLTVGLLNGGYEPYVVPDKAYATFDIRLTPPNDKNTILNLLNDSILKAKKDVLNFYIDDNYKKLINDLGVEIQITGDRPYIEKSNLSKSYELFEKYFNEKGCMPKLNIFTGYTDTAVIAYKLKNINTMSYGPGTLKLAHKPDEYVEKKDILKICADYCGLIDLFYKK